MYSNLSVHEVILCFFPLNYQYCNQQWFFTFTFSYLIFHLFDCIISYTFLSMPIFSYFIQLFFCFLLFFFFSFFFLQSIGILILISILGQVQGLLFIGIVLSHHRYVCTFLDKFFFSTKNSSFILFTSTLLSSVVTNIGSIVQIIEIFEKLYLTHKYIYTKHTHTLTHTHTHIHTQWPDPHTFRHTLTLSHTH